MIVQLNSGLGDSFTYLWEFGDGQSSTDEKPLHDYLYAGIYEVRLTVTNDLGSYVFTQPVTIASEFTIDLPFASFTVDVQSGAAPLTVVCTDTSTGDISGWEWYADDVLEGTVQAFSHQFTTEGAHVIRLKAIGAGEAEFSMNIRVGSVPAFPLISAMAATNTSSITGTLTTTFSATVSDNPETYLWEFGDGGSSDVAIPTYKYNSTGTFEVSLTVVNGFGSSTSVMTVRVIDAGSFTRQEDDYYIDNVKVGYYVVDSPAHEVLIYKNETEFIESFGTPGVGQGQFNNPTDMTIVGATKLIDRVEL
ncbi:PKD domain-containing protein [Candidatus Pacearchaeota archaeon]|nr:PKD domain-containing protein [Candidatus Pacearchaeota archaeon]